MIHIDILLLLIGLAPKKGGERERTKDLGPVLGVNKAFNNDPVS